MTHLPSTIGPILFLGFRTESTRQVLAVWDDGGTRPLAPIADVPPGELAFDWGEDNAGAGRLAAALLAQVLDVTVAAEGSRRMVSGWLVGLEPDAWLLTAADIRDWWGRSAAEAQAGDLDAFKFDGLRLGGLPE